MVFGGPCAVTAARTAVCPPLVQLPLTGYDSLRATPPRVATAAARACLGVTLRRTLHLCAGMRRARCVCVCAWFLFCFGVVALAASQLHTFVPPERDAGGAGGKLRYAYRARV